MKSIAALVFPRFQTLDLFGSLDLFGWVPGEFSITVVGEKPGHTISRSGQRILIDRTLDDSDCYDLLLIPGGPGTPMEQQNPAINEWLLRASANAETVMGVCTGSALLASIGLLDGRRATTNKMDFLWSMPFGPEVKWVGKARWVEDGKFFTSSGVSAGMDMALAVIEKYLGQEAALKVMECAEYTWHQDPDLDPFVISHHLPDS